MFKNLSMEALGVAGRQSETIELALSYGFKGIDLDVTDFAEQVKTFGLPHARRLIDSAKLKLGTFKLPFDWQGDDETFQAGLAKLPELASLAAQVGCTRAVTYLHPGSNERPYHQQFQFCQQRLNALATALEPTEVQLAVGCVAAGDLQTDFAFEFIRDFDTLQMLLAMIPSRAIGYLVDLWDIRARGGSLESLRKLPAEKLVAVQIADAAEDASTPWVSTNRTLPAETNIIDLTAALTLLAEVGFEGPLTPIPDKSCLVGHKREMTIRTVGERIDAAWKAAGLNPQGNLTPVGAKK